MATEEPSKRVYFAVVAQIADKKQGNFDWIPKFHLIAFVAQCDLSKNLINCINDTTFLDDTGLDDGVFDLAQYLVTVPVCCQDCRYFLNYFMVVSLSNHIVEQIQQTEKQLIFT